jgi:hypothetical protein
VGTGFALFVGELVLFVTPELGFLTRRKMTVKDTTTTATKMINLLLLLLGSFSMLGLSATDDGASARLFLHFLHSGASAQLTIPQ